jgi:hypothetical protein
MACSAGPASAAGTASVAAGDAAGAGGCEAQAERTTHRTTTGGTGRFTREYPAGWRGRDYTGSDGRTRGHAVRAAVRRGAGLIS